jgi:hypothetical protein
MQTYRYEQTDTFGGDANYCWVKRGKVRVPELVHYGYSGSTDGSYSRASKAQERVIVMLVKRELGITGFRCDKEEWCGTIVLRPRGCATILFIDYCDDEES